MGSTFGVYNVAYSGMYVSQSELAATTNNLANVDTTGASRVRVAAEEKNTLTTDAGSVGTGVNVASISRTRDALLDKTYRTQNAQSTYLSVKSGNLEYMDEILQEFETDSDTETDSATGSDGVLASITSFFSSWSALATDTDSKTASATVVSDGQALVSTLTTVDQELQQLQQDAVTGVKDGVKSLNDLASQVAELNGKISQASTSEASYLEDQRDALLDQMSSLADISTSEKNGVLQVSLGGTTLVNGINANTLTVEGTGTTSDPLTVKLEGKDSAVSISGGSIGAYLEDADQTGYEAIDSSSIPYTYTTSAVSSISNMRQAINSVITTLADKINSLQTSNGGVAFFTTVDNSQKLSSSNIQVNSAIVSDSSQLVTGSSGAAGDNTIANKIAALATDTTCYSFAGQAQDITGFYEAMTTWVGTQGDTASSSYDMQSSLVTQLDSKRQAVSGISIDEEMSNMIQFQNAYAASAKVMSTIDTLLAGIIEDLG